jgi:hypothetical protein
VSQSIATTRQRNLNSLFQQFAEREVAAGAQPRGLEKSFAELLEIKSTTWSMAKSGARPIGDKLARQIEQRASLEPGWLDEEREPAGMSAGEQQFLSMALKAYRGTNSAGRKELKQLVKTWLERREQP